MNFQHLEEYICIFSSCVLSAAYEAYMHRAVTLSALNDVDGWGHSQVALIGLSRVVRGSIGYSVIVEELKSSTRGFSGTLLQPHRWHSVVAGHC
jgi:hypothetical protein